MRRKLSWVSGRVARLVLGSVIVLVGGAHPLLAEEVVVVGADAAGGAEPGELARAVADAPDPENVARATGGRGGSDGGSGGDATASAVVVDPPGTGPIRATASAAGGAGGTGGTRGGNGGVATLGPVRGLALDGRPVTVVGTVRGGDGGSGTVRNGDGADAHLVDAVEGASRVQIELGQFAIGGNAEGNRRAEHGRAGDASSLLTRRVDTEVFDVQVQATGGKGDADGGRATALLDATNDSGAIRAQAGATGGDGARDGGDAVLQVDAMTTGDRDNLFIRRGALGPARIELGARGGRGLAGRGGDATSETRGIALGDSTVEVEDSAVGGRGGRTGERAGNAISSAFGSNAGPSPLSVTAAATGGSSAVGAMGGEASVSARGVSTGGGVTNVRAAQRGGRGGDSDGTIAAGAGADSVAQDVVSGGTAGVLRLEQSARGGDGGDGDGSHAAGLAGRAASRLEAFNELGGELRILVQATGGQGGGGLDAAGQEGGEGRVEAIGRTHDAPLFVDAIARGGAGGVVGVGSSQTTRMGGAGVLETVLGISTGGADVTIHGEVVAGDGGNGRSVMLENAVDGETTGRLELKQAATAGVGGDASGGRAISRFSRIERSAAEIVLSVQATGGDRLRPDASSVDVAAAGSAEVEVDLSSLSGSAVGLGRAVGGRGAFGASGNGGIGGRADVRVSVRTAGDGHAVQIGEDLSLEAIPPAGARTGLEVLPSFGAFGGIGGSSGTQRRQPGRGGDAVSRSTGIAEGNSSVFVADRAVGGQGGLDSFDPAAPDRQGFASGGQARSLAQAMGGGGSPVEASSRAEGGAISQLSTLPGLLRAAPGPGPIGVERTRVRPGAFDPITRGGSAIAEAVASGEGRVSSRALAIGGGGTPRPDFTPFSSLPLPPPPPDAAAIDGGDARAIAAGTGLDGSVRAEARSFGRRGDRLTAVAFAQVAGGTARSSAETRIRDVLGTTLDTAASASAVLDPDRALLAAASDTSPEVQSAVQRAAIVFVHGHLSAGGFAETPSAIVSAESILSLQLSPDSFGVESDLFVGLFNPEEDAGAIESFRFEVASGDVTLAEFFGDEADFLATFSDQTVDLSGLIVQDGGTPLRFTLSVSTTERDAGVGFDLVVGARVPEPGAAILILLGVVGVTCRVRSRRAVG